ncbi:hypothetical protein D9C73_009084 [Collichthys lucidus]|uniref:Uncharacterized protein n=1 Tax=Collichthys lucidus TaxID=240159 RepID=A0A4U5UL37_COLLU|nr:hypothetical protein D9C73_009084 [Collichthys lucidus]
MTALRRIHCWFPLLKRSSCRGAAPASCSLLHTPQPRTAAAAAAAGRAGSLCQIRRFTASACRLKDTDGSYTDEEEEEDGDFIDDSEVEELFQQQVPAGIGEGQHSVFIVHPDVKWGSRKQHLTTGNSDMSVWDMLG